MPEPRSAEFLSLQEAVAGRYFVDRELGRGGMGVVYLARDVALDRLVAIKLLPASLAHAPDLRARFLREARTAAQLSHPHIVPIHAVEEHASIVFFVMAYVDGETLGERVRRAGPLSPTEGMRIMQEVAWALAHAHARGVVHRDVKPDNILLERETGRAMVTDFGIARAAESATPAGGAIIGTPQYMSPEQARGEAVDGRSDLYSLGATMFFALTGRLPFEASTASAFLLRLTTERAPAIGTLRAVIPRALTAAIDRCLEQAPEQRFGTATDVAEALRTALSVRPETPPAVRQFVTEIDAAGSEAGTALTGGLMSLLTLWLAFGNDLFVGIVFYTIAGVLFGLAGMRLARLTMAARGLLASGYGLDHVKRAAVADDRVRLEQEGKTPPPRLGAGTAAWAVAGLATSAGAMWVAHGDTLGLAIPAVGVGIIAPTVAIRRVVRDWLGGRGLLRRLMQGRVGRWLFGVAGAGLESTQRPRIAGGEPTVVAIARAADELFLALPPAHRKQLGDVPAVISRLEAEAMALNGEEGAAADREAMAVAALESLRLDLLRLNAGGAPKGELTRDLDDAVRIGERIDARLARRDEPTPA